MRGNAGGASGLTPLRVAPLVKRRGGGHAFARAHHRHAHDGARFGYAGVVGAAHYDAVRVLFDQLTGKRNHFRFGSALRSGIVHALGLIGNAARHDAHLRKRTLDEQPMRVSLFLILRDDADDSYSPGRAKNGIHGDHSYFSIRSIRSCFECRAVFSRMRRVCVRTVLSDTNSASAITLAERPRAR